MHTYFHLKITLLFFLDQVTIFTIFERFGKESEAMQEL